MLERKKRKFTEIKLLTDTLQQRCSEQKNPWNRHTTEHVHFKCTLFFLLLLYLSVSPFTRSVIIPLSLFADLFPHRVVCVATITAHYVYVSRARPLQYLSPIDSDKFRSTIGIRRNAQIIPNMMIIENENFSFG